MEIKGTMGRGFAWIIFGVLLLFGTASFWQAINSIMNPELNQYLLVNLLMLIVAVFAIGWFVTTSWFKKAKVG